MKLVLAIIIATAIAFGWWRLSLLLWPNRPCWWCKGTGRNFGSNRKRWGTCWFCKNKPRKRRGAKGERR